MLVVVGRVLRLQNVPVFDSLLSHAGLGHLGKGWIVCDTTTTGLTGSSTQAETVCTDLKLIGSSVATARH